jgi:hypothetical protein
MMSLSSWLAQGGASGFSGQGHHQTTRNDDGPAAAAAHAGSNRYRLPTLVPAPASALTDTADTLTVTVHGAVTSI